MIRFFTLRQRFGNTSSSGNEEAVWAAESRGQAGTRGETQTGGHEGPSQQRLLPCGAFPALEAGGGLASASAGGLCGGGGSLSS